MYLIKLYGNRAVSLFILLIIHVYASIISLIGKRFYAGKQRHLGLANGSVVVNNRLLYLKMAALLKKRALAEFSQSIQSEEAPKPRKKLRIVKKAPLFGGIELEHLKCSTPDVTLNLLIQLSENLPSEDEHVQAAYQVLLGELHRQQDAPIKAKMVSILKQMVKNGTLLPATVLDDILPIIRVETSHKVLLQMMNMLHEIGKVSTAEGRHQIKVLQLAKQFLTNGNHQVKCSCLNIISDFTPFESGQSTEFSQAAIVILGEHSYNQDPRVRTTALQALLHLHNRGYKLDFSLYGSVCKALDDDYEGVRMAALRLIQVLSALYSERLIDVGNSKETNRLVDDAFAKICNSVSDLSLNVRVLAASLLGNMTCVSINFLEQTLDKKLMSNLRKKRSAHERQRENFESGEWSTGQKWADDAPKEEVDAENVNLISSGACGAFVHGLEDEFLEVRNAALDSLCHLALRFTSFACLSLDFLVDMFNDEIEEVRLKAIQCLGTISHHIVLREDQLETILALLEDFSMDIREGLHELMGKCQLSTKTGLKLCIDNLLENLKRYPQDKRSIWKALQLLGSRHPYLTLPLVPELLGIHPFLELPEPDVEDATYMSILILVFNSAAKCPTMISLFEEYIVRHHSYLRDSFPNLVPDLKLSNKTFSPPKAVSSIHHSNAFLQQVLERVSACERRNVTIRMSILETAIGDLKRLSEIEPALSAVAKCISLYVQCQLLFLKVLSNRNWINPSVLSPIQSCTLKSVLEKLLQLTFGLTHQFLGLKPEEIAGFKQLRLRALAVQLVVVIRSNTSALALCEMFLDQVQSLQKYIEDHNLQSDSFTTAVFQELDALEEPKPGSVARILQPLLQTHACPSFKPHRASGTNENLNNTVDLARVRQATATIQEPSGETDSPHRFTAGLVLGVSLDAQIENIENIKTVRVKIKYPDQQVQFILPPLADFRQQGFQNYRLYTTVLLSHSVWSEACHVELSLILDFSDLEGSTKMSAKTAFGTKAEENTIELSKPVQVYIAPKPMKKGI